MNLLKEDYEEAACLLEKPCVSYHIDINRVINKLDEYLNKNDYAGAERHLDYWLAESEQNHDQHAELTILNEQIGLYRKTERKTEATDASERAIFLANEMKLRKTVTMATTLINAATAYKAFGKAKEALPLYEEAKEIYETLLPEGDKRLAGLYNNMALAVMETNDCQKAEDLFFKALDVLKNIRNGEAEQAITYCNLCDLAAARLGTEAAEKIIEQYLEEAENLLNTENLPKDGYYAFVCEKCAPTFDYYGYFAVKNELLKRAESIYERS